MMFNALKRKIRFKQYSKALNEPLNPLSSLSILTVAYVDPKMNTDKSSLANSSFATSIDTIAFSAFLCNLMISQASVGRGKEKWFAKYYLEYLSKLASFIFATPANYTANCILNRLVFLEDAFISSHSIETLVNEYANLLHRDSIYKKFTPIESGAQMSFNALEHVEYHIEATSLLPFFEAAIRPSIPDVVELLQSI